MALSAKVEELLERLAELSEADTQPESDVVHLDPRTRALAAIGAAVCIDAPTQTFRSLVAAALQTGASAEEVVGCLLAVAPAVGEPKVVSVAPKLALALGYDVDAAFELE